MSTRETVAALELAWGFAIDCMMDLDRDPAERRGAQAVASKIEAATHTARAALAALPKPCPGCQHLDDCRTFLAAPHSSSCEIFGDSR